MRLAEGAGLLRSDFIEQDGILCVNIRPHPWRSLKTASSERVIPLVGSAKWAAERILAQPDGSAFAFPNYNDGQRTNANSASAALNKWLKTKIGQATPFIASGIRCGTGSGQLNVPAMSLIRLVVG